MESTHPAQTHFDVDLPGQRGGDVVDAERLAGILELGPDLLGGKPSPIGRDHLHPIAGREPVGVAFRAVDAEPDVVLASSA